MGVLCKGIAIALILSFGAGPARAGDQPQGVRELDWVKNFTAEFFEVALASESNEEYTTSIAGFLSPELVAGLKEKPPEATIPRLAWQYKGGTFQIKMAELAPNGSEVILKGELIPSVARTDPEKKKKDDETATGEAAFVKVLTGIDLGERQDKPADVTIRVAKDTDGGRWSIRFIRVKLKAGEKTK